MTHIHPDGDTRLAPPLITRPTTPADRPPAARNLGIDHSQLRATIAARRGTIANLEAEMVTKCEAAAARNRAHGVDVADRGTWDRLMWERYLSAAAALESDYLPDLLRLHAEVRRLERLMLLPTAREALAA